jgi:hypothetical protein
MHNFDHGKSSLNFWGTIVIFKKPPQTNKSPKRRKFVTSGHLEESLFSFAASQPVQNRQLSRSDRERLAAENICRKKQLQKSAALVSRRER